ncbi:MAG: hydroxyacylglutathione hydrolase [Beijerinckiaceae bacterium]
MPAQFEVFRCLTDNTGVLMHDDATGATAAIDVPDAQAVLDAAARRGWTISHILITHEHADHIQGVAAVKDKTGARVIGPALAAQAAPVDDIVRERSTVNVGSLTGSVQETPGHAAGHVIFHFPAAKAAFVGDVLFVMGCGRAFGSAEDLFHSVEKVRALPEETQLFTGHDYTFANARFAVHVDGDNTALRERFAAAEKSKDAARFWGVTTLKQELATNPYLRLRDAAVKAGAGLGDDAAPVDVFVKLRTMKNTFA